MAQTVEKHMQTIFKKVQFNKTDHPRWIKELTKLYERTDLDEFWELFILCLQLPLTMPQQHPHVINTLEFCANFCISFYSFSSDSDTTESMSPFLSKLFDFLLSSHNAKDKTVRYRICHFLNMLLNSMGDNAFIDDNLYDKITISMMDRLLDKSPKVRAQAVLALQRLQDPSDDQCPVIRMYLFHLSKDVSNEVRKAVLTSMGKNQKTLQAALARTRDIDENVRKLAYEFISKITVRSLTIKQRECLLKDGLKDRSEIVRACVCNVLLPAWLQYYQEYINLIHALDAGIGTEIATLALQMLFKNADVNMLLEQVPIDKNTKLIPIKNLKIENVLYWKCVIQQLYCISLTEEVELILPELSKFCDYIREFIAFISSKPYEIWEKECHMFVLLQLFEICKTYDLSDEVGRKNLNDLIMDTLMNDHCSSKIIDCIVSHLSKVMDNPNNMFDAVVNVISEIRLPSKETAVIPQVTAEQQHEIKMQKTRLKVEILELEEELYETVKKEKFLQADSLKEKIKVLKEKMKQLSESPFNSSKAAINDDDGDDDDDTREEKSDTATMVKCLSILYTAIQNKSICALTPTMRSMMSVVLHSLDHPDDNVHILALKVLTVYCTLDKELAKKHIMIFFYQFSLEQENQEIWIVALKGIFDLLLCYGLEYFEILQNPEDEEISTTQNGCEKSRLRYTHEDSITSVNKTTEIEEGSCNLIEILTALLNSANQDLRNIAIEGFCKLLVNQRINSSKLISRLIILCYNPVNADDLYLHQCLSIFFEQFITRVPDAQEMLENAYFPTLRVLCDAPDISPLQEIDKYHLSRFILNLTRQNCQKSDGDMFYTHNNLAFAILAEILNPESKIDQETLIRSLPDLYIHIEDGPSKQNLRKATENVMNMVMDSDKRLLKFVERFKKRLEGSSEIDAENEDKSENED